MENNVEVPQKIKNSTTIWSSNATARYLLKGNKNTNTERYMNCQVQCSIIYSSQDMEATEVSINKQTDKEDVIYISNKVLLSHKTKN